VLSFGRRRGADDKVAAAGVAAVAVIPAQEGGTPALRAPRRPLIWPVSRRPREKQHARWSRDNDCPIRRATCVTATAITTITIIIVVARRICCRRPAMIATRCCPPGVTSHVEALKSHHHHHYHHHQQQQARGIGSSNVADSVIGNALPDDSGGDSCDEVTTCDKYKGTGSESNRGGSSDAVQGRLTERSMLKIEKLSGKAALHSGESAVSKCVERMKSTSQETGYNKHEAGKGKSHDVGHGYKVENLRYYGELKSYADFKAHSAVDKQMVSAHEKSHLHHPPSSCEKSDKCHGKVSSSSAQGYSLAKIGQQQSDKSHHSGDHYYHRSSHLKPPSVYQVYQETKYSYNVSGVPGTPAQASAAAAFFARSVYFTLTLCEYDSALR